MKVYINPDFKFVEVRHSQHIMVQSPNAPANNSGFDDPNLNDSTTTQNPYDGENDAAVFRKGIWDE